MRLNFGGIIGNRCNLIVRCSIASDGWPRTMLMVATRFVSFTADYPLIYAVFEYYVLVAAMTFVGQAKWYLNCASHLSPIRLRPSPQNPCTCRNKSDAACQRELIKKKKPHVCLKHEVFLMNSTQTYGWWWLLNKARTFFDENPT
jgi:hypothetical protein